jgi:isopentenyl-diphosphate delta-isomerase
LTAGKFEAHRRRLLHRAVSVFVFSNDNLLLQKRSTQKYHSPSSWSNTACTHPRPGELPAEAASRRLFEEMGVECLLSEAMTIHYDLDVGSSFFENEYDHIFIGYWSGEPSPDGREVSDWRWAPVKTLEEDMAQNPKSYTPWLLACWSKVLRFQQSALSGRNC